MTDDSTRPNPADLAFAHAATATDHALAALSDHVAFGRGVEAQRLADIVGHLIDALLGLTADNPIADAEPAPAQPIPAVSAPLTLASSAAVPAKSLAEWQDDIMAVADAVSEPLPAADLEQAVSDTPAATDAPAPATAPASAMPGPEPTNPAASEGLQTP